MKTTLAAWLVVLVIAGVPSLVAEEKALHYWENDLIKTEVNDYEYPYDQISYRYSSPEWVSNLVELKVALWDGSSVWEYNTTKLPNGFNGMVEVQDWTFSGSGANQFAHVVLGDHLTTPSFTVDVTIHMEGNGSKAIRSDFVITSIGGSLPGAKLYLYGDPNVSGNLSSDRSAYDSSHGLCYAYDPTTTPHLYFGLAPVTGTQLAMHYYGHLWSGTYGTEPMRAYMLSGQDLPDVSTATAGDQVVGWSWSLGTVSGSVGLTVYMGVGASLADLIGEVWAPIHRDGFESGNTSWW